jgi:hypothetical protein
MEEVVQLLVKDQKLFLKQKRMVLLLMRYESYILHFTMKLYTGPGIRILQQPKQWNWYEIWNMEC